MTTTPDPVSGSHNQHARLAPSSAKSWSNCTASLAFMEANKHRIPPEKSSAFSEDGTICHDWATKFLLNQVTAEEIPEDYREHVVNYANFCKSLIPEGATYMVETQVSLFYQPDHTGTLDFGYVSEDLIVISDLKFGAGVLVLAEANDQLVTYAMSLVRMFEDLYVFDPSTKVVIAIYQPRHREGSEQKPWEITLADLATHAKGIEYAAIQAHTGLTRVMAKLPCGERNISPEEILEAAPMLRFLPGEDVCRWKPCRAFCPKRLSAALEDLDTPHLSAEDMLAAMPDLSKEQEKHLPETRVVNRTIKLGLPVLTDEYLVTLYRRSKAIKKFLDDVEEFLEGRLLDGEEVPGTQLVMGREGNRAWANEEAADAYLKQKLKMEERYSMKLKSPTQIEALLGDKLKATRTKNLFQSLITRSSPKRVIALATDKRPAVGSTISAMPDIEDDPSFE